MENKNRRMFIQHSIFLFRRTTHVKTHRAGTDRNFYLNVSSFRFVVPNYDLRWPASLEMGLMVRAEFVFTGNGT